ncbi:MAG: HlyD family efflux transporter periplasmic adaptor subunit [Bacteroidales bacterium]|jgi:multidrug resistance efflux pump|nr:HlyD family efflux transporter periplasmic adaptor subunit [Bacteroidales bacterium]MDD2771239.1 HlyD family efflux transporter periplasmic adaptor subunit [Bacteroidales bacterium]MDD3105088.1 HlyD family efflux transporter periplasmic adaptor subunit [Bacteroidales bacterium]MDD3549930.1 HlyD family efflux transporter periplasmic adaptor subunit [Bacteroidales bacterium]MDY0182309.1 HlyD family efflux transporter periplasmic adaptor subunit [Proteiniphilum sp.]
MENEEKKYKEIELRSEEVQEVMSQIPPWILRHGITALFVIVLTLLIGSWFFKYPDVIKADITVTSLEPPASIIARSTGKIDEIYVGNNQHVSVQTPLAVIQNPANSNDILSLIGIMSEWETSGYSYDHTDKLFAEKPLSLGTIQSVYAAFLSSLSDYRNYKTLNYYPQKIASQKQQLVAQKEYHNRIIKQEPVVSEQFRTSRSIFERDSVLISKNVISGNEYDISKNSFLQNKRAYLSFNASLKQSEMQLMKGEESLLDLQQQATELERKYQLSLQNAAEALNAQLKAWERDYLLVSPINGVVTQMGVWSSNQNVNAGETIFTVVPTQQDKPKGKAMLPIQGAGKVKIGQRVNVRINNFPDQEFGYLVGKVGSISSVPTAEGFYVVEIDFPHGMQTNYDKTLPITQQMQGSADIITEDLRLMERFFMPVKRLIKGQQ